MAKKVSEHDALKGVDLLLEPLSSEERQRVFDWIVLKYKVSATNGAPQSNSPGYIGGNKPKEFPSGTHIKDFITQKKPTSLYERVACLVYHLEKFQDYSGVKTSDITKANTDARQTKFTNATVYVANATNKYGFLASIGKGKKGITPRGEALVEALPDRDAVKKTLEDNPGKRKNAKKKAKNK